LFVGAVAGWVRSQWVGERVAHRKVIEPVDDLRVRELSMLGAKESLILTFWAYQFQPANADEAAALRRNLARTAGFSRTRGGPWPVAKCFKSTPRWGFARETSQSSTDPPGALWAVQVRSGFYDIRYYTTWVALPWWTVVLVFAIAPALATWR